jgi:hypothetical protein
MRIILTLSCDADEPPPWPDNRPSSSARRCSSLWTVLLSSSTTESVVGAIVPECEGDHVEACSRCASERTEAWDGRNGRCWELMKTKLEARMRTLAGQR